MNWVRITLRKLAGDACGTELAEAAVVLPLLFVMLIAVFWFGQAFRIYGALTHAAREGARAAVAPACATCAATTPTQNATDAVNSALTAAHLDTAQLADLKTWNPPALCACGSTNSTCTPKSCNDAPAIHVCVQTNVQLSYINPQGGAGACGTSVSMRYKYPYRFTLPCWPQPCTSLDLSHMSLPAQAQMRLETQ
jgi:Flp pilus assembly protein TadG